MDSGTSSIAPTAQRLKGKIAIVTGGASGFGKAIVELFVQHGAKVIIADIQDDQGIALCNKIIASITNNHKNEDNKNHKEIVYYVHCNISNEEDVKNLVDVTMSKHGKLDIMFNNAGILGEVNPSILQTTSDNFKNVFETNVYGGFLGAKHAARVMIPKKSGVILFTASAVSVVAGSTPHAYTMSKHAIIGLMKNLCVEMGQYGIRVNAISPSGIATPLAVNGFGMEKVTLDTLFCEANVLKGVAPKALDIAQAGLFLASDEAKFVSGANLLVDGGYSVTNPSISMFLNIFSAPKV